jgi:hypothetical protein
VAGFNIAGSVRTGWAGSVRSGLVVCVHAFEWECR